MLMLSQTALQDGNAAYKKPYSAEICSNNQLEEGGFAEILMEIKALLVPWLPYLPDTARVGHPACQRPTAVAGVVLVNLPVPVLIAATARKLQKEEKERMRHVAKQTSTSPAHQRISPPALPCISNAALQHQH